MSCAFFVSAILTLVGLAKSIHGTVDSTVKELVESGWVEITEPKIGAVVVWEKEIVDGEEHKHIGFCVSHNEAISNSSIKKVPNIFWHEKLN